MKALKILSNINSAALAAYIPYIIINFDNFFFGKNKGDGIIRLSVIMFFITFICAGIIMISARRKNIETSFRLNEIRSVNKATLVILAVIYLLGLIIMFLNVHDESLIFYFATSTLALAFTIAEKVLIPKINTSHYYRISIPWYFYPIPFVVFLGGGAAVSYFVPEEKQSAVIIILFILSGIMMFYLALHSDYIVDEDLKIIEKNKGILSFFKSDEETVSYENISNIKKKDMYYIVINGSDELRINRFFSGIKRFEKTLSSNGIIIE